ncbi:MAG: hypothetical protein KME57_34480 [Scytonema hyalinum WJT4-NPBG1]|jgi:hypothetical protein|nr:hypothetical protein [Scytonema hyalinum WJT4-NPBG1]
MSQFQDSEIMKKLKQAITTIEKALETTKRFFPENKDIDQATASFKKVRPLLPSMESAINALNKELEEERKKRN